MTLALLLSACSSPEVHTLKEPVASTATAKVSDCQAAHEFITAMTYLRETRDMQVPEAAARKIALGISAGCTGAAGRFVDVAELLRRSGLDSGSSIDIAREAALKGDAVTATFTSVFRQAFLHRYLDLALADSLRLARSLSLDFNGNPATAMDDFQTMVDFCVSRRHLDLSKPICAKLAGRIAKYSEKTGDDSVAAPFIEAFEFLTTKDGPGLVTADALRISEQLVAISPFAVGNFEQTYTYGVAKSGLKLGRGDAVRFAQEVAKHSVAAN